MRVLEQRARFVQHSARLKGAVLRELGTPKAVAVSFGAGAAAGYLRCRGGDDAEASHSGGWLRWLIQEVGVPLALGTLSAERRD